MTHNVIAGSRPEQDYINGKIVDHSTRKQHYLHCLDCDATIYTSSYEIDDTEFRLLLIEHRLDALEGAV